MSVVEHRLRIPWREPWRGDAFREVLLLEGPAGWGEASPLPGYPCSPEVAYAAAREQAVIGPPQAVRGTIAVNALVRDRAFDPAELVGFPCVKVKVGGDPDDDDALVARVRDAVGPSTAIRVDANGAWDVETAVAVITRLARHDLELVEQPVASLEDLARVRRRVPVPVAADESVRDVEDARQLARLGAADAVVLKVQPLGGTRAALRVAEAAGVPAIVTSMFETSIGLAAGVALAAALPARPWACGLATIDLLAGDVCRPSVRPVDGTLNVRVVAPDPELLERYRVSTS